MQDFLDKAIELEALKFGSFKLKSGMESDYFFNIAAFFDSESLSFLADCYVSKILDLKIDFDLFFVPAYKGIPLASDVRWAFGARGPLGCRKKCRKSSPDS